MKASKRIANAHILHLLRAMRVCGYHLQNSETTKQALIEFLAKNKPIKKQVARILRVIA